jgi:hypothetical protein
MWIMREADVQSVTDGHEQQRDRMWLIEETYGNILHLALVHGGKRVQGWTMMCRIMMIMVICVIVIRVTG